MRLNQLLGTEFPIIQGGMANVATGAFAAAMSNAGALGLVAAGGMDERALRQEIRRARALTTRPVGVNLMLMNPHIDELARVVVDEGVSVVTTGAGNPGKYVDAWKEAGIKVFPVVAAPVLARRLARYDIDGVIAEGTESGGHVGETTTMALVPQVVDAVDVPVIAAGGIADGRQMAAALALGACGVQVGTCLLASEECPVHDNYKQLVVKAGSNDTVVTGRASGAPVRVLKNKMAREYLALERTSPSRDELEAMTLGSLRRAVVDGDLDSGSFMAGQVAAMVHGVRPAREIFERMVNECNRVCASLGGALHGGSAGAEAAGACGAGAAACGAPAAACGAPAGAAACGDPADHKGE